MPCVITIMYQVKQQLRGGSRVQWDGRLPMRCHISLLLAWQLVFWICGLYISRTWGMYRNVCGLWLAQNLEVFEHYKSMMHHKIEVINLFHHWQFLNLFIYLFVIMIMIMIIFVFLVCVCVGVVWGIIPPFGVLNEGRPDFNLNFCSCCWRFIMNLLMQHKIWGHKYDQ